MTRAELQALLDTGGDVVLPSGQHLLDGGLLISPDVTSVTGAPGTLLVLDVDAPRTRVLATRTSPRGDLVVRSLTIDGQASRRDWGSATLQWHGLGVFHGGNVLISDVHVRDCWGDGIYVGTPVESAVVQRSSARQCLRSGVMVGAVAAEISGCEAYSCGLAGLKYEREATEPGAGVVTVRGHAIGNRYDVAVGAGELGVGVAGPVLVDVTGGTSIVVGGAHDLELNAHGAAVRLTRHVRRALVRRASSVRVGRDCSDVQCADCGGINGDK